MRSRLTRRSRSCNRSLGVLALSTLLLTTGCGDSPRSPLTPVTPAPITYLRGLVTDTFLRPVAAARVEIVSGPLAGIAVTTSDDQGKFDFTSTAADWSTVTVRVSKSGFETATGTVTWQQHPIEERSFVIRLHPDGPPVTFHAGNYRLTIGMDLATARGIPPSPGPPWFPAVDCPGFPVELATRTYDATITEYAHGERSVTIMGPTVKRSFNGFMMQVLGDEVAVTMEWSITEQFAGNRYLDIGGGEAPRRLTVDGNAVHVPVNLALQYCELSSDRGLYNVCQQVPLDRIVRHSWCASEHGTMTFTRR